MIEETYEAIDLIEWYYVLTRTFEFGSKGTYTRLEFLTMGRVEL